MPASALLAAVSAASLNLCTDEYLLLLANPRQIASVTHLAHQPAETPLWRLGRRHPSNNGSLLDVVRHKPALVLTMGGGARDHARLARRIGVRSLNLPYPRSLADVRRNIVVVGTALGREPIARRWESRIVALENSTPSTASEALWLGGGGRTVAAGGLEAAWMRLAGLKQRRVPGDRVTLEQLLVEPPQVLLRSDYRKGQYSGQQRWLAHPLARRARAGRVLATDGRPWTCLGPALVPEILRLRRALGQ